MARRRKRLIKTMRARQHRWTVTGDGRVYMEATLWQLSGVGMMPQINVWLVDSDGEYIDRPETDEVPSATLEAAKRFIADFGEHCVKSGKMPGLKP
jgi:hypothetical protein